MIFPHQTSNSNRRPSVRVLSLGCVLLFLTIGAWWFFADWNRNPQSIYDSAAEALSRDDYFSVRSGIEKLRALPDQGDRVHLLQARLNLKVGLVEAAVRELEAIEAASSDRASVLLLLGEAFYRLGRHPDAERVLLELVTVDPAQTEAHRWLAASYYDIGAMDPALEQLAIVSQQAPEDPRPNRLRGLIEKDFERYPTAIAEYEEALRRNPTETDRQEISLELAECLIHQHLYDEAARTLTRVQKSATVLVLQAQCALALNSDEEIARLIEQALQLDPTHLRALLFQANLQLNQGEIENSRMTLEKAVAAWPKEFEPRYQLASVYRRLGLNDEADTQAAEVERLQKLSDEFTAMHELAFTDTRNADLRFRLGQIAAMLEKWELAGMWFRATLALDPNYAQARSALNQLQAAGVLQEHSQ